MKTLNYSITINKPREFVFDKMIDKSVYADWAKAWGEGMTFEGEWKQGEYVCFFDTSRTGTKVIVNDIVAPEHIKMTHVAMVEDGTVEVTEVDEVMQKWFGAKEEYYFSDAGDGTTLLEIRIVADEMFEEMMQAWDPALVYFKEICES